MLQMSLVRSRSSRLWSAIGVRKRNKVQGPTEKTGCRQQRLTATSCSQELTKQKLLQSCIVLSSSAMYTHPICTMQGECLNSKQHTYRQSSPNCMQQSRIITNTKTDTTRIRHFSEIKPNQQIPGGTKCHNT